MSPARGGTAAVVPTGAVDAADAAADAFLGVVAQIIRQALDCGVVSFTSLLPAEEQVRVAFAAAGGDPGAAIESAERVLEELQRVVARGEDVAGRRRWATSLLYKLSAPSSEFDQALVPFRASVLDVEEDKALELVAARWRAVLERTTTRMHSSMAVTNAAKARVEELRTDLAQAETAATAAEDDMARKTLARLRIAKECDRATQAQRQHALALDNAKRGRA